MKSDWISSLQKTSRGFTLFDVHLVEPLYNVLYVHLVKKKFKVLLKNVTTNQTEQYNSSGTVVSISSSLFLFFCSVSFSPSFSFFPSLSRLFLRTEDSPWCPCSSADGPNPFVLLLSGYPGIRKLDKLSDENAQGHVQSAHYWVPPVSVVPASMSVDACGGA